MNDVHVVFVTGALGRALIDEERYLVAMLGDDATDGRPRGGQGGGPATRG